MEQKSNTQLPAEVVAEIKEKTDLSADFLSNDETIKADYLKGYKQGWKEGATEYAPRKVKHEELQREREQDMQKSYETISLLRSEINDYKEAYEDHKRLVREIDVILCGEGAAQQASLCDLVGPIRELQQQYNQMKEKVEKMEQAINNVINEISALGDGDVVEILTKAIQQQEGEKKGGMPIISDAEFQA